MKFYKDKIESNPNINFQAVKKSRYKSLMKNYYTDKMDILSDALSLLNNHSDEWVYRVQKITKFNHIKSIRIKVSPRGFQPINVLFCVNWLLGTHLPMMMKYKRTFKTIRLYPTLLGTK